MQWSTEYVQRHNVRPESRSETPALFWTMLPLKSLARTHVNLFLMSRWHGDWTSNPKQKSFVALHNTGMLWRDLKKKKKRTVISKNNSRNNTLPSGTTKAKNNVTKNTHTHTSTNIQFACCSKWAKATDAKVGTASSSGWHYKGTVVALYAKCALKNKAAHEPHPTQEDIRQASRTDMPECTSQEFRRTSSEQSVVQYRKTLLIRNTCCKRNWHVRAFSTASQSHRLRWLCQDMYTHEVLKPYIKPKLIIIKTNKKLLLDSTQTYQTKRHLK